MIVVYRADAEDFSTLGLSVLQPLSCRVQETAGQGFTLTMEHPLDDGLRYACLAPGNIIKAPCPVRETPRMRIEASDSGAEAVSRDIYRVQTVTGARLRLRAGPGTSHRILGRYAPGTEVVKLAESGGWLQVAVCKGGASGWMHGDYLVYSRTVTEAAEAVDRPPQVIEPRQTREQLFRILSVEPDAARSRVTVFARHIFYDLAAVLAPPCFAPEHADAGEALAELTSALPDRQPFSFYCSAEGEVSGDYTGANIVGALLEPERGLVSQTGARLIRDNFDVFLLRDELRSRGAEIRHRKNLTGAVMKLDHSGLVTRIRPVGKKADGGRLTLSGEGWVDSPRIGLYPVVYCREIEYDVTVGEDGVKSEADARRRLCALAEAEFSEKGADLPSVSLEVEFVPLENTAEYAQYAHLLSMHLYDTVRVCAPQAGIRAELRINGYEFDCLLGRYISLSLGGLSAVGGSVYGYELMDGSVSGTKIIPGSADGAILRNATIQYAKIARAAIEQLSADSITALTARIGEIVAGSVTADKLYVALAEIVTLMVESINAENINVNKLYAALAEVILLRAKEIDAESIKTDTLAAQYAEIMKLIVDSLDAKSIKADTLEAALAKFVTLYAATGEFDFATIANLVANAMSLQQGAMDTVYIRNLAVTSANLLSATLGSLILKGDDGKYYRVYITADGEVRSEEVTVSEGEIVAGQTGAGLQIVETTANIANLNAQTLQASSAVINNILATALTADKITAADALIATASIPTLYATAIRALGDSLDLSANRSVQLLVSRKNAVHYREKEPEEFHSGDLWIRPSDGKSFLACGLTGKNAPELTTDEDFVLMYRFGEDADEYALDMDDDGMLLSTDANAQVTDYGNLYARTVWVEIAPSELHTSYIHIAQDAINIGSGGNVNIHAGGAFNVDSGAAHFRTGEYSLSILSDDGSEDSVMEFDADSKVLRVSEIEADNMRPFIAGTTEVSSGAVGGVEGLKGLLEASRYEHLVYTQSADDLSTEAVEISRCDSMLVEIRADAPARVPPLHFTHATGNIRMENLSFSCTGQTAVSADSGSFILKNCAVSAGTGVYAARHARVVWIGADDTMETAGACTTAFEAVEGADVRIYGLIPTGEQIERLAGVITVIDVRSGTGGSAGAEETTVTLTATRGYYGTNNGWNGGSLYQGYSDGKGRIYGCMRFTLPEGVTSVKAATLTLARNGYAGSGSKVDVFVYGSETAYGERPALGTLYASRELAAAGGASCSLDVTQAAQALADGDIRQLVLWTGEASPATGKVYSRHYAKFDSAKLKITY